VSISVRKPVFHLVLCATLLLSWPPKDGETYGQYAPLISPPNINTRFHFDSARALYLAGEYEQSLTELDLSEQSGEKVPRRPYYVALNHEQLKQHDRAISILAEFLKQSPKDEPAWLLLATAQFYGGHFTTAASSARHALELDAKDTSAYRILGLADLKMERRDDAYKAWLSAVRANAKDAEPPYLIGRLFYESNRYEEATKWFRRAVVLSPGNYRALYYWGLSCQTLGRLDEALTLYRRSMALNQSQGAKYSWVYGSLGKLLTRMGQEDEAQKVLEAGTIEAPDGVIFAALGDLQLRQHRRPEAEASLRHAISLDPTLPDSYYTLGRVLHAEGRVAEAEAVMQTFNRVRLATDARLHRVPASGPSSELALPEQLPDLH
jgi:tetratricopeptide (TPR) repeat protein